ncbi:response regulator transcription factor [Methylobrevis pamukkalensis]|uniref:Transcriptional regulatory protein DegU n=1 Tax=Methylobrevis pamukkalensis TaxID=1439726 RepID=A0A1E3H7B2_9HYPH|nr:response regulator transcription factor [Methylobrevis pamukkalensis]ODN72223.1 Transcriptional regulatory protein DegU [Methylobrevis pamukkalensis]
MSDSSHSPSPSGETTTFLIVDDHPLFREALQSVIRCDFPSATIAEAGSIDLACAKLGDGLDVDLALVDLSMPDTHGFDGLLRLRTAFPRLPLAVVSAMEDPRIVREALSYGIAGFIPKSSRREELARAIGDIMSGLVYVPAGTETAGEPADRARADIVARMKTLTPQQIRVLQMLRQGLLNKQIAYELTVGETTVKAHVSEILRKLGVYSRTQAVIEAGKIDFAEVLAEEAKN